MWGGAGSPAGAEAGWEQGATAAYWSVPGLAPGSLSSSQQCGGCWCLSQPSSVLPPPHFEIVPMLLEARLWACGREATSSDGTRSRHGCVAWWSRGAGGCPGSQTLWSGGPCHPHYNDTSVFILSLELSPNEISARWASIRVGPLLLDLKKKKKKKNTLSLNLGYISSG